MREPQGPPGRRTPLRKRPIDVQNPDIVPSGEFSPDSADEVEYELMDTSVHDMVW